YLPANIVGRRCCRNIPSLTTSTASARPRVGFASARSLTRNSGSPNRGQTNHAENRTCRCRRLPSSSPARTGRTQLLLTDGPSLGAVARRLRVRPAGCHKPLVAPASDEKDFVEIAWVGQTVAVGDTVRLSITGPCIRCVMTTLAQGDLP